MSLRTRYFILEMIGRDITTPMERDNVEGGWINIFDDDGYPTREDAVAAIESHFEYLLTLHIKAQDFKAPEDVNYKMYIKPELVIIEKFGWY